MQYKELKQIIDNRIVIPQETLPLDALYIASQLNIRLKNSTEAAHDFNSNNTLDDNHAIYALYMGEYTIYYDEKYPYKNFSVAHEIAHHLLEHTSDGAEQHRDAQLMAAMIVAPIRLIKKHKINSASELAERCKIPIDVADVYWLELKQNSPPIRPLFKKMFAISIIAILLLCLFQSYIKNTSLSSAPPEILNVTTAPIKPSVTPFSNSGVFITPSGEKYHKSTCRHIKNSEKIEITIDEAERTGYTPCKDCLP